METPSVSIRFSMIPIDTDWISGATAFASYGGFWLSFATLYIPQFEVVCTLSLGYLTLHELIIPFLFPSAASYTVASELDSALGIYLCAWGWVIFLYYTYQC